MKTNYYDENGKLKEAGDLAREIHSEDFHCSETITRAVWPHLFPNKPLNEDILKMTMVMHGGIADSMSSHCGGLTTGILMIGLLYGRDDIDGDARLAPAIARKYWQMFLDEFGTSHCTTLKSNLPLTGEAPTRCGCIMVRSARLILKCLQEIEENPTPIDEMYLWRLDRTKEPCHEQIPPMKSSEEVKAEKLAAAALKAKNSQER